MLNPYGEKHIIDGYTVWVYPGQPGSDTIEYTFEGESWNTHKAYIRLCAWARRLHGNPPSGTKYGSATICLPNGKRRAFPLYV